MVAIYNPQPMEDEDILVIYDQIELLQNEVPCYHFYIICKKDMNIAGHISLRTKISYEEEYLWGNMGYTVYQKYQGRRYAYKASKLVIGFARKCKMNQIYMTVDPTNIASIKTILNLGGYYLETIEVPKDSSLYEAEQCDISCRYCVYI
ncbi:hypothetical protein ABPG72_014746 [Tetrahymena utriculariae]